MSGPTLITDADVLAGRVASPIVLGPGVLLTPAARDRAVARGMVIVEVDGSVGGAPAAHVLARVEVTAGAAAATPSTPPPRAAASTSCGCAAPRGRCACGAADVASDATLARLPDGVYLVRVTDGRAREARPVSGAGRADPSGVRGAPPA